MALVYAKPEYYDELPETFEPTQEQLETAAAQVYNFIGSGKKTHKEIEDFVLVTQGYGASHGATAAHVVQVIALLVDEGYIKVGVDYFYPEEEAEEEA